MRERRILDVIVDQGVKRNLHQEIQVELAQLQRVTRAFWTRRPRRAEQ
jgi:hypothetical protein